MMSEDSATSQATAATVDCSVSSLPTVDVLIINVPMATQSAQLVTQKRGYLPHEQTEAASECAVATPRMALQAQYDVVPRRNEAVELLEISHCGWRKARE